MVQRSIGSYNTSIIESRYLVLLTTFVFMIIIGQKMMTMFQSYVASETKALGQSRGEELIETFMNNLNNSSISESKRIEAKKLFYGSMVTYLLRPQSQVCRWGAYPLDCSKSFGPTIENDNKQMKDSLKNTKRFFDEHLSEQTEIRQRRNFRSVEDIEYQNNEREEFNESMQSSILCAEKRETAKDAGVTFAKRVEKNRGNGAKYTRFQNLKVNCVMNKINTLRREKKNCH